MYPQPPTVHHSAHIRLHLHSPSTLGPITGGAHTCKRGKSPIPPRRQSIFSSLEGLSGQCLSSVILHPTATDETADSLCSFLYFDSAPAAPVVPCLLSPDHFGSPSRSDCALTSTTLPHPVTWFPAHASSDAARQKSKLSAIGQTAREHTGRTQISTDIHGRCSLRRRQYHPGPDPLHQEQAPGGLTAMPSS